MRYRCCEKAFSEFTVRLTKTPQIKRAIKSFFILNVDVMFPQIFFTNEVRLHAGIIGMAENEGLLSGSAQFTLVSHPFKSLSHLSLQRQTIMIHAPSHKTSKKW